MENYYLDIETGQPLKIKSINENKFLEVDIRNGFIRKVYGIVGLQLLVTVGFSMIPMVSETVRDFMINCLPCYLSSFLFTFISLIVLFCVKDKHPYNLIWFTLFSISMSYGIGIVCATTSTNLVIEAVGLTTGSVLIITGYVWKNQDKDFSFLEPFLFVCLWILVIGGFLRIVFPSFGTFADICWAGFGCLVFLGFLVLDTFLTMTRYDPDDYILAAMGIYLDIINLFLYILIFLSESFINSN